MQEETPADWAETSTPPIVDETRPHSPITEKNGWDNNFYNILHRSQHVDKQIKNIIITDLQFGKNRVPIRASVPLNEDTKMEKFEICIVRVPIGPRLQWIWHEQRM